MKFSFSQYQNLFLSTGPVCEICGKVFTALKNLNQHLRNIHEKSSATFSCTQCDYFTCRKHDLNRHIKRHKDIVSDHNIPPKIAHHEPIPNIMKPAENEKFLSDIEQQEHTDILNTQAGLGLSQIPSTLPPPIFTTTR